LQLHLPALKPICQLKTQSCHIGWRAPLQKRDILSDTKLPDVFRVALAKSLQDDLFAQVD
jgi:hypothetical protein